MALWGQGFTFVAVPGGGVTQPQTFNLLITGTSGFNWTAKATQCVGWRLARRLARQRKFLALELRLRHRIGQSGGTRSAVYYGLVLVSSPGTVNSPQQFEVVLNVLTPDQNAGATVSPSGLIFKAPAVGTVLVLKSTFQITNLSASDAPLALKVTTTGGNWLVVAPDNGTVPAGASQ